MWKILAVASFLILAFARCGRIPSGGIVDNGNHPPRKGESSDEPLTKQPDVTPTGGETQDAKSGTPTVVLGFYHVDLPNSSWVAEEAAAATTIAGNGETMRFTRVTEACDVVPVRNERDVDVYNCTLLRTDFVLSSEEIISVEHTSRAPAVQAILDSFRER